MEEQICRASKKVYTIDPETLALLDKISPVINWEKYTISPSKYCPEYNHQLRLQRRNEMHIYKWKSTLSGNPLLTCYHPASDQPLYSHQERWSDNWDPMDYGIDYDQQQSFFTQFQNLFQTVPKMSLNISSTFENCDYCNYGLSSKNCYMCSTPSFSENCYYSQTPYKSYFDVDGFLNVSTEYCYQCFYSSKCAKSQYLIYCQDCSFSYFLMDCQDCQYCFGCVNMSHKKYCFFNEQLTKKEYESKINTILWVYSMMKDYKEKFHKHAQQFPKRATRNIQTQNTTWDLNVSTSDCSQCFGIIDAKDCIDSWIGGIQAYDLWSSDYIWLTSRVYNCIGVASSDTVMACVGINNVFDSYYCFYCYYCEYCFGCVWLKHKKYCIFNKQYSKDEYNRLIAIIIDNMKERQERGEFFPWNISPFPYQDTIAHEHFPLDKEDIQTQWRNRYEPLPDTDIPQNGKVVDRRIENSDIVTDILWEKSSIIDTVFVCEISGRPYKILWQELDFYIQHNIPLPRQHPQERYRERLRYRLPYKLRERVCDKSWDTILTPYSPERPETVWADDVRDKEFRG